MTKSKKLAKPRPNLARDLDMLKEHMPRELGGDGKSVEAIAEERSMSRWAVYKSLAREDVREAETAWIRYIVGEQRNLGPVAVKALRKLMEEGDSATVNAFFKRMSPSMEPTVSANVEQLTMEIKLAPEDLKFLEIQPEYRVAAERAEAIPVSALSTRIPDSFGCPVQGCQCRTAILEDLGKHLTEAHRSQT